MGSWPSPRHDKAQSMDNDVAELRSQERGFGVPRVAAPSAGRLGLVQSLVRLQKMGVHGNFAGCAKPTAVTFFGPTPQPPRHGGRPDTAHWSCWRARPSKGSASTLCALCLRFPSSSFASMCCTRWTWPRRRTRLAICFSNWSQAWVGRKLFSMSCICVCACVCVCLCSACMSSCALSSLQALGSSARSRGAAGLLSCGTRSNFTSRRSARNPGCRVSLGR